MAFLIITYESGKYYVSKKYSMKFDKSLSFCVIIPLIVYFSPFIVGIFYFFSLGFFSSPFLILFDDWKYSTV